MFRARAGARRNRSVYARLYRLCRGARGEIASATGDVAPAAARFAKDGWFGLRRRAVKLAKQRENSVSLAQPPRLDRARRTSVGPSLSVVCRWVHRRMHQRRPDCRRNDDISRRPSALRRWGHARILGRPAYGRPCRLGGRPRARIARRAARSRRRRHRRLCWLLFRLVCACQRLHGEAPSTSHSRGRWPATPAHCTASPAARQIALRTGKTAE